MRTRLLCFPYAGASSVAYARWIRRAPASLEVIPVELPGRGRRHAEPLETDIATLIARLVPALEAHTHARYALFGHSFGALVAFECAAALERLAAPAPVALFASGCEAPSAPERKPSRDLSDAALLAELERRGGTPPQVLANAELMQLTLPILRADFRVIGGYRGGDKPRISTPIHVLSGTQDSVDPAAVAAWSAHTRAGSSLRLFPGGHFFLHPCEEEVLAHVSSVLSAESSRGEGPCSAAPTARSQSGRGVLR